MQQYHDLLRHILQHGKVRTDRTGTGTKGVFGYQMRFDLNEGFPLLTTKKIHMKSIIHELLWFLSGDTNVKYLQDNGVRIWDEWATAEQCARFGREEGDLGPVYGHQWRRFGASDTQISTKQDNLHDYTVMRGYANDGVDQIANVVHQIKNTPDSRRLLVTGWNPKEATSVALPPCHTLFQFYVQDGALSCQLYQRSADVFLGVPFNIASYALLTHMIAQVCGLKVGEFIHTFGDVHIYSNHMNQVNELLSRDVRPLPTLKLNPAVTDIFSFKYEDVTLEGYNPHPAIKAEVAV